MHFPVIINGLDFLHSSVSSLVDEPEGRALKYAVLHLQFAAETLFKARLELHAPALVWSNPEKFDERLHRQGHFKSVGTKDALVRLRDEVEIAEPVDPDDAGLKALVDLRNRLTHFGASDTAVAVEARAIPVLDLLLTFIDEELLPNDNSDSAADAWELMERTQWTPTAREASTKPSPKAVNRPPTSAWSARQARRAWSGSRPQTILTQRS
ncbi:hypothetical protein [Streptomyces rhizosphaericus]|nr:hypothetical protein [Streptomyces rhizosphaericus]